VIRFELEAIGSDKLPEHRDLAAHSEEVGRRFRAKAAACTD
jgi:hypothetical protein